MAMTDRISVSPTKQAGMLVRIVYTLEYNMSDPEVQTV